MKTLNAVIGITFCSLFFLSTPSLAGKQHAEHWHNDRHHASKHQEYGRQTATLYGRRGHSQQHNTYQQHGTSSHKSRTKVYKYRQHSNHWNTHHAHAYTDNAQHRYKTQQHTYNRQPYKYSNYSRTARRVYHTANHLSHLNSGLNLYFKF